MTKEEAKRKLAEVREKILEDLRKGVIAPEDVEEMEGRMLGPRDDLEMQRIIRELEDDDDKAE
jgi:hypothetical protein